MGKWWSRPIARAWVLPPSVIALIMAAGWWWRLRPEATVWGPVVSWVGVVGTVGALIFAGQQVRLARHQQERLRLEDKKKVLERNQAMIDAIGVSATFRNSMKVKITNAGVFPIYSATLWPLALEDHEWKIAGRASSIPGGILVPGGTEQIDLYLHEPFLNLHEPILGVAISFRDTDGAQCVRGQTMSGVKINERVILPQKVDGDRSN